MASFQRPSLVRPTPPPRNQSQDSTKDVSELMFRLQTAIERGHKEVAAQVATELAKQRASLSIEELPSRDIKEEVRVIVHIDDQEQRAGHVFISVSPTISIKSLKNKIFRSLGFPPEVQRWLVGRSLGKDSDILCDLMDITPGSSVFLYLLSARAVGLTAKGFQDEHMDEICHQGINNLQIAQQNNPLQRSVSEPQGSNTAAPKATQGQGHSQGQGYKTSTSKSNQITTWTCTRCTFAENKSNSFKCELCDTTKGVAPYLPR